MWMSSLQQSGGVLVYFEGQWDDKGLVNDYLMFDRDITDIQIGDQCVITIRDLNVYMEGIRRKGEVLAESSSFI